MGFYHERVGQVLIYGDVDLIIMKYKGQFLHFFQFGAKEMIRPLYKLLLKYPSKAGEEYKFGYWSDF